MPKIFQILPVFIYVWIAKRWCEHAKLYPIDLVIADNNILLVSEKVHSRPALHKALKSYNQAMITTNKQSGANLF